MKYDTLKEFAAHVIDAGTTAQIKLPDLSAESKHWQDCFASFMNWHARFLKDNMSKADNSKIFARSGNMKLPFLSFSSLPFIDCPGAGACKSFCYSPKGWRNVHPFFRQLRNSLLVRHRFDVIAAELERLLKLPSYEGNDSIDFRLYVDGDFPNMQALDSWMALINDQPSLKAYGYTKSWQLFTSFKGSWPKNYVVNLSEGSKYHANSGIARAMEKLPCVRGWFLVKGAKRKLAYNTPEYRAEVKKVARAAGITRHFPCPGTCGNCTSGGHLCGDKTMKAPIVILQH